MSVSIWALLQPRRFPLLVALLGTVVLSACVVKRPAAVAPAPLEKIAVQRIAVQVTNRHFLDIAVYAVCEGQRTRIGVAAGNSHTLLDVSGRLLGPGREMQLVGDAIGSEELAVTEMIIVQPGQFIELLLESRLARSSVGVY
jgi:hypothetical protein